MAGSRRRRRMQRQRASRATTMHDLRPELEPERVSIVERLPPELLAEIHRRIDVFRDRVAFAVVCSLSRHLLRPEPPWLILPSKAGEAAAILSVANIGDAATLRTSGPAMRDHVVVGSSGGWLVTADALGALRMANPVTGAQADLPAITTCPVFFRAFSLCSDAFLQLRYGGSPPPREASRWGRSFTLAAHQMRQWFYRKVVLAASSRPGSYAAMLILDRRFGVPAFASAEDPVWRMAPSHDGVEDAIHHGGRFHSVTYSGEVQAWDRDAETGEFVSTVVAPRLPTTEKNAGDRPHRTYLAGAADGRLMAVTKHAREVKEFSSYGSVSRVTTSVFFKVRALDEAQKRWEEVQEAADMAVFVGVNGSMCVSVTEHSGVRPGCVYYTDDEFGEASLRDRGRYDGGMYSDELPYLGVYSLKDGKTARIEGLANHPNWPPAAWFTPSV